MSELYWLTRLDAINVFIAIFIAIFSVINLIYITNYLSEFFDYSPSESKLEKLKKGIKSNFIYLFILSSAFVLIPTTKDAYIIYGIGGTIDYIKNDSIATKIPHKVIVAMDKYINSITSESDK